MKTPYAIYAAIFVIKLAHMLDFLAMSAAIFYTLYSGIATALPVGPRWRSN